MSFIRETVELFGYWGILVAAFIGSLIASWLLAGGQEWCQKYWGFLKHASQMNGPTALPLLGNALHFACSYDEILNRLVTLVQPYDYPFRFWMGMKLFVIAKDPRDIKVVMNSSSATSKPSEYRFLASCLGSGIVTESGSPHRAERKLVMPMVSGSALNMFLDCFDRQSQRCVERLEDRVGTGEFDIIHYMDNCTLDIVLETIMGIPGKAQDGEYKDLTTCCARALQLSHERTLKAWLHPDWIYSRTTAGQQFASDMKVLHKFADTLIAQKKDEYCIAGLNSDSENSPLTAVLTRLIAHNEKNKLMDQERLRDEITNIWMPAQDPTALSSSFLLMMLGLHPEVQDKVRAEVREVIGDGDIRLEHVSKLKYLEMVFKETVRLFPVGPMILREVEEDLDFAPKGCTIALFVYVTHRDPKYWTDPEKFYPERFTPENSAGRDPYAFIPFSSGIRGCIGQKYAVMLLKVLVSRVVQKYRISKEGSLETLRLKAGISIRSIDGYNVSITKL